MFSVTEVLLLLVYTNALLAALFMLLDTEE